MRNGGKVRDPGVKKRDPGVKDRDPGLDSYMRSKECKEVCNMP